MADRERSVLDWLRERGPGLFSYRECAQGTGITRDQAWVACLALADTGTIDYVQWIDHWGTDTFELRSVRPDQEQRPGPVVGGTQAAQEVRPP